MRHDDDARIFVGEFEDGRGEPLDPGRIAHRAVLHRHVEVGAQQDGLALGVDVVER